MRQQDRAMTVRVPAKLLKATRHKCVENDVSLSEVVRDLLAGWVDGSIALPQPTEQPKAKSKGGKT